MLWLLIFLTVFLVAVGYLAFAPLVIELNSTTGLYRIRLHYLASARLVIADETLKIEIRIVGWRKVIDLLANRQDIPGRKVKQHSNSGAKSMKRSFSIETLKAVVGNFKIKKCFVNIDTGSMAWNGVLYPVFYFAGRQTGKSIRINFLNENEIILEIRNNFACIMWAFIYSSLKSGKNGKSK